MCRIICTSPGLLKFRSGVGDPNNLHNLQKGIDETVDWVQPLFNEIACVCGCTFQ